MLHIQNWNMFCSQQIRQATAKKNNQRLVGEIEVDEPFVGGKNINRHIVKKVKHCQGSSYADKVPVFGLLQRKGKMTAHVVSGVNGTTLNNTIQRYAEKGSVIYSDGWHYGDLTQYISRSVDHGAHFYGTTYTTSAGETVVVTTNGIENTWSVFKRALKGTCIHVSRKHLQRYVDEFVFRYNPRKIATLTDLTYIYSILHKQ